MPPKEEEYQDYQDRPMHWDKRGRQTAPHQDSTPDTARSSARSPLHGFARGCGCLLIIPALIAAAIYGGVRALPAAPVFVLNFLVESAIDGSLSINEQQTTIPERWREPVRATVHAYEESYENGMVPTSHAWETCLIAGDAIQPGRDQDERLAALVFRMRELLLPETVATLPLVPIIIGQDQAQDRATVATPAWDAFRFLSQAEREAQHGKRDQMARALSRVYGPTSRPRILPEGAVVHDFGPGGFALNSVVNDWTTTGAPDGTMSFQPGARGFSDAVSQAVVVTPAAHDARAVLEFTTEAGSVDFWYDFDGAAAQGSRLTVAIDGQEIFADPWPTSNPGNIGMAWRHADLNDLQAGSPARITITLTVTSAPHAASVFIDDFVFGP